MRIACVHIPQFALQSVTRTDPSLRGASVAVVGAGAGDVHAAHGPLHSPIVLACSRAAWSMGVRLGMTATAVRALGGADSPLHLVASEPQLERETVRALAEAMLAASPMVDSGGRIGAGGAHLALYAEVPSKTRGAAFGDRLVELLDGLGLSGRVGIADDRFTAWVAAAHGGAEECGVVSVPRGGSASFLSPRPLSMLSIAPEVQHMLEALGVRTLGEFATLPAPSVARPVEADYQALARGDGGGALRPYVPGGVIREEVVVGGTAGVHALSGPAAIALIAHRVALRLAGRGRGASRLEVEVVPINAAGAPAGRAAHHDVMMPIDRVLLDAEDLATVLAPAVDDAHGLASWRLRVMVANETASDATGERSAMGDSATNAPVNARLQLHVARDADADAMAASARGMDPVSLVLSTSGSLFSLSPPTLGAERRDAHRRTRRGKQRRRIVSTAQSRLFVGFER